MIACSNCGKPTTPRTVPKGPRGPWVANECLHGCMNGKYPLTTKAPKAPYSDGGSAGSSGQGGDLVELSRKILAELVAIRMYLNAKTTLKNDPLEKETENTPF